MKQLVQYFECYATQLKDGIHAVFLLNIYFKQDSCFDETNETPDNCCTQFMDQVLNQKTLYAEVRISLPPSTRSACACILKDPLLPLSPSVIQLNSLSLIFHLCLSVGRANMLYFLSRQCQKFCSYVRLSRDKTSDHEIPFLSIITRFFLFVFTISFCSIFIRRTISMVLRNHNY